MSVELIIFLVALILTGLRVWMGWRLGATAEMRYVLAFLFATLVSLRSWHPLTAAVSELITMDPQILAAGVFALVFVVAWMLAALIVNLRGEVYQSVSPNPVDNVLGAICGLASGALLGGSVMLFFAIALPGKLGGFEPDNFPVRLNHIPTGTFRLIEEGVAGVPADSPAHTLFPLVKIEHSLKGEVALVWK